MLFKESLVEIQNDHNIRELMALCERHSHVYLFVEHTNTCDEQYNVEDGKNKGDLEDYFPEDEFDDSNTSNDDLGSEDDDEEELERVTKEKKLRKEELNRDLVHGTAQTEGQYKGKGLAMPQGWR